MAQLLGSKNCIKSLSRDVGDVQDTVEAVLEKIGRFRVQSWKYPDKLSHDVDIPVLLNNYSFSKDTDFNKIAHVVLIELVVDRLLFMFQCITEYLQISVKGEDIGSRPKSRTVGSTMSIGLTVKKYWSKFSHFHSLYREKLQETLLLQEEKKKAVNALHQLEIDYQNATTSGEKTVSSTSSMRHHQQTQTHETCFVPCESCALCQDALKNSSTRLTKMCEKFKVPSSKKTYGFIRNSEMLLPANSLTRIALKQQEDIDAIEKHVCVLVSELSSTKEDLSIAKSTTAGLEHELRLTKSEREKEISEFSTKLKHCEEGIKNANTTIHQELLYKEELERKHVEECDTQRNLLDKSEKSKQQLKITLENEKNQQAEMVLAYKSKCTELDKRLAVLTKEYDAMKADFIRTSTENLELKKDSDSFQLHHSSLLNRVQKMDKECGVLLNKVATLEEDKTVLDRHLSQANKENASWKRSFEELKDTTEDLQSDNKQLTNKITELTLETTGLKKQLSETHNRLELLNEYPSFDAGFRSSKQSSTSQHRIHDAIEFDVPTEMRRQIDANKLRMDALAKETRSLEETLMSLLAMCDKLPEANQVRAKSGRDGRVSVDDKPAAWLHSDGKNIATSVQPQQQPKIFPRPPSIPKPDFPEQGGQEASTYKWSEEHAIYSPPLRASRENIITKYTDRAAKLSNDLPKSSRPTWQCADCGKGYSSKPDLDIHSSFCYGRL